MIIEVFETRDGIGKPYWQMFTKSTEDSDPNYLGNADSFDEILDKARDTGYILHAYTYEWWECKQQQLQELMDDLRREKKDV